MLLAPAGPHAMMIMGASKQWATGVPGATNMLSKLNWQTHLTSTFQVVKLSTGVPTVNVARRTGTTCRPAHLGVPPWHWVYTQYTGVRTPGYCTREALGRHVWQHVPYPALNNALGPA